MLMPITNRNLAPGTRFVATYKKETHTAESLMQGDRLMFRLETIEPVTDYKSLSAAGSAIMGGIACNGWRFWSLAEGEQPPPVEAAAKPAKTSGKAKASVKVFYRSPNQKGLGDGETRFYCNACACGFISRDAAPEACPQGHRLDDAELTASVPAEVVA